MTFGFLISFLGKQAVCKRLLYRSKRLRGVGLSAPQLLYRHTHTDNEEGNIHKEVNCQKRKKKNLLINQLNLAYQHFVLSFTSFRWSCNLFKTLERS